MSDLHHHDRTAELYRSFGPRVYRRCLRILDDEEAAHDATQEVFLKLLANMPRLQGRDELLPWILNVARNHCLNVRRAARHDQVLTHVLEQEEPETVADLNRALLARALLERVEPSTRSVVLGVLGAGLRHEDAAAALGMSPAAVARRIQRFLASTREYMTRSEYLEAQGPGTSPTASGARRPLAVAPVKPPPVEAKPPPPARAAAPSHPWRHLDPDLESAA